MKKYSVLGNKKKVTMETNVSRLKVVGNNCIIRVQCNQGDVEVIGNDCRLEIKENYGTVNLVGSGGVITIERRSTGDNVTIVGPNCQLLVDGKEKRLSSYEPQLSPFSKDLDDVIESIFTFVMR
ncbi:uncharacterized protein LOC119828844 [Zerene cesonia]|uniref:uncharacterized protein LOC119828844 n=1 Tax=Zerene cesonia TaxID=33412 RepID=UPI0018E4E2FC|nr:uncharacterized protein LOC119828844 [Zerene cesonia]